MGEGWGQVGGTGINVGGGAYGASPAKPIDMEGKVCIGIWHNIDLLNCVINQ